MKRCPETGSVDTFLKAEGAAGGRLYENDRANWSRLEAAGADDGYISFYAQNAADCPSADREPSADFLSALVVRFKDSASAMSDYKTSASNYSLADSDVLGIRSAGGAAVQGTETGLGSNSVTVSVVFGLIALNRCFWQHNEFEVLVDAAFISASDVKSTCQKIDGRIT